MLNKYWFVSWWYIFTLLDEYCHKIAIENIGECVTSSSEIKFLKPVERHYLITVPNLSKTSSKLELNEWMIILRKLNQTKSSIILNIEYWNLCMATFTFIKNK